MKTLLEIMARSAGGDHVQPGLWAMRTEDLERFANLVRADEREACVKVCESHGPTLANGAMLADAIRAKGQA